MPDQEEQKSIEPSKAAVAPAPLAEKTQPQNAADAKCDPSLPQPQMSKGEKLYNRLVYQGMNYWLNLGISLWVTDMFVHKGGKPFLDLTFGHGKPFFERNVKRITNGLLAHTPIKSHRAAKRLSEIAFSTFTLNSGGNILLIPTKILEDRKRPAVHWLNEKLGVEQRAPDGHKETADEIYIEQEQPKQSWGRMIWRRTLGWVATTSVGLSIDWSLAKKLPKPIGTNGHTVTHIDGQQVFTDGVVKGANAVLKSGFVPGGKALAANETAQRYMGYAALDWIYTVITSTILHKTNGAHKEKMSKEIGDDCAPPAAQSKSAGTDFTTGDRKFADIKPNDARKAVLENVPPSSASEKISAQKRMSEQESLQPSV